MNRAFKLLGALERRGFVVRLEHGTLQIVPCHRLTPADRVACLRVEATLVRMFQRAKER